MTEHSDKPLSERVWSSIEWAPRDGTHILVKFEGTTTPPTVAHYWSAPDDPGGWFLSVQQNAGPEIHPTHWRRLPAERDVEGALARFEETALRIKQERDWLFAALAPFADAYKRASDPGTSDLDNEQPFHLTVDLGDCRAALAAYNAAKVSS